MSKRDNCNKRSGLVLTAEPCNITAKHSFKYSGLANTTAFGIDADGTKVTVSRKAKNQANPSKGVSKQVWGGHGRRMAKAIEGQTKARADLTKAAKAKITQLAKAARIAKASE